jgi:hypothetical protein
VVTATQTITNDAYRATADGNLSTVGEVPAVTFVGQPVTGKPILLLRLDAGVGSSRERSETGLPCGEEMRYTTASAVVYLHGDHLGSTSLTTDASGAPVAQSRYLPCGQERRTDGALVFQRPLGQFAEELALRLHAGHDEVKGVAGRLGVDGPPTGAPT